MSVNGTLLAAPRLASPPAPPRIVWLWGVPLMLSLVLGAELLRIELVTIPRLEAATAARERASVAELERERQMDALRQRSLKLAADLLVMQETALRNHRGD